ncbi:hypothetical protein HAX54_036138 [Datura stramonium]|uniref:Uncharacterized protein n=1 Tax=Datura stramonium TaxID=4076 RepID=A0ABS8VKA0_DATST|nr:hypothetical protein [Datura stramonium]
MDEFRKGDYENDSIYKARMKVSQVFANGVIELEGENALKLKVAWISIRASSRERLEGTCGTSTNHIWGSAAHSCSSRSLPHKCPAYNKPENPYLKPKSW